MLASIDGWIIKEIKGQRSWCLCGPTCTVLYADCNAAETLRRRILCILPCNLLTNAARFSQFSRRRWDSTLRPALRPMSGAGLLRSRRRLKVTACRGRCALRELRAGPPPLSQQRASTSARGRNAAPGREQPLSLEERIRGSFNAGWLSLGGRLMTA